LNLLEQSPWYLIPYVLLMLVMVHAMMEFTVSLLVQRPPAKRKPITANELRQRLLTLHESDQPYRLLEGQDCDLEIYWKQEEASQPGRWAMARGASDSRLRFLLDEQRHELRMNQVSRSYFIFLGLHGWLPRLAGYASVQSGPPGQVMTQEISRIANRFGWSVRPVLWWFQATHSGYHFLEAITPAPLRRWPARRFWGFLYPLSYVVGMGYLATIIGPLDYQDVLLFLGISAAWWGVWGFLVWMLRGFPAFWRRRRR
jgi:hypothetical protein